MRNTLLAIAMSVGLASAAEQYSEGRITQIEPHDNQIVVFLADISGAGGLPSGNGATNEPGANKPWLYLANTAADVANRKHLLASALVAMSNGTSVRFRWEDSGTNAYRIVAMLVRQ